MRSRRSLPRASRWHRRCERCCWWRCTSWSTRATRPRLPFRRRWMRYAALQQPRATGLINALLRRFLRQREQLLAPVLADAAAASAHPAWLFAALRDFWPDHWQQIVAGQQLAPADEPATGSVAHRARALSLATRPPPASVLVPCPGCRPRWCWSGRWRWASCRVSRMDGCRCRMPVRSWRVHLLAVSAGAAGARCLRGAWRQDRRAAGGRRRASADRGRYRCRAGTAHRR